MSKTIAMLAGVLAVAALGVVVGGGLGTTIAERGGTIDPAVLVGAAPRSKPAPLWTSPARQWLTDAGAIERTGSALAERLRGGGHVIFLRNTAMTSPVADEDQVEDDPCAGQRNLSAQGREQAARLGERFAALGIPVGEVLSAEPCRMADTARLAFGRVTVTDELNNSTNLSDEILNERAAWLLNTLRTPPAAGTNTVLVGPVHNLADAIRVSPTQAEARDFFLDHNHDLTPVGLDLTADGEAVVFAPDGQGHFAAVGDILIEDW